MPKFDCAFCGDAVECSGRRRKFCSLTCSKAASFASGGKCSEHENLDGLYCVRCGQARYWKKHRDYMNWRQRQHRVSVYGLTSKQWDAMFDRQGGKCPICDIDLPKYGDSKGRRAAAIDHDHKTKRVRGLVCHVCNRSKIGKNTVESTKRLLAYLKSDFDGRDL